MTTFALMKPTGIDIEIGTRATNKALRALEKSMKRTAKKMGIKFATDDLFSVEDGVLVNIEGDDKEAYIEEILASEGTEFVVVEMEGDEGEPQFDGKAFTSMESYKNFSETENDQEEISKISDEDEATTGSENSEEDTYTALDEKSEDEESDLYKSLDEQDNDPVDDEQLHETISIPTEPTSPVDTVEPEKASVIDTPDNTIYERDVVDEIVDEVMDMTGIRPRMKALTSSIKSPEARTRVSSTEVLIQDTVSELRAHVRKIYDNWSKQELDVIERQTTTDLEKGIDNPFTERLSELQRELAKTQQQGKAQIELEHRKLDDQFRSDQKDAGEQARLKAEKQFAVDFGPRLQADKEEVSEKITTEIETAYEANVSIAEEEATNKFDQLIAEASDNIKDNVVQDNRFIVLKTQFEEDFNEIFEKLRHLVSKDEKEAIVREQAAEKVRHLHETSVEKAKWEHTSDTVQKLQEELQKSRDENSRLLVEAVKNNQGISPELLEVLQRSQTKNSGKKSVVMPILATALICLGIGGVGFGAYAYHVQATANQRDSQAQVANLKKQVSDSDAAFKAYSQSVASSNSAAESSSKAAAESSSKEAAESSSKAAASSSTLTSQTATSTVQGR